MEKKLPDLDINLVLKSLVYFSDIVYEPIKFKNNNSVDFSEVKKIFITEVEKI